MGFDVEETGGMKMVLAFSLCGRWVAGEFGRERGWEIWERGEMRRNLKLVRNHNAKIFRLTKVIGQVFLTPICNVRVFYLLIS
jgi:hypothetical protein